MAQRHFPALVQQGKNGAGQTLQRPLSGVFAQTLDVVIPKASIDAETGFDACFQVIRDGSPESPIGELAGVVEFALGIGKVALRHFFQNGGVQQFAVQVQPSQF